MNFDDNTEDFILVRGAFVVYRENGQFYLLRHDSIIEILPDAEVGFRVKTSAGVDHNLPPHLGQRLIFTLGRIDE